MTDVIKVPYDQLNERARVIRHQAEIVEQEVGKLSSTIESLNWMGQRNDRFRNMWNDALPTMHDWVAVLRGFADELDAQANRMRAVDNSY